MYMFSLCCSVLQCYNPCVFDLLQVAFFLDVAYNLLVTFPLVSHLLLHLHTYYKRCIELFFWKWYIIFLIRNLYIGLSTSLVPFSLQFDIYCIFFVHPFNIQVWGKIRNIVFFLTYCDSTVETILYGSLFQ